MKKEYNKERSQNLGGDQSSLGEEEGELLLDQQNMARAGGHHGMMGEGSVDFGPGGFGAGKRYRRTANEIERRFQCWCGKAYGSEGSLN